MQLVIISIICLIAGAIAGYLFHKSKTQNLIVEKEVLAREVELLKNQREDFEKSARAVMYEASKEVSQKLLDDHKRENAESKKAAEEITKKETENLHKEFEKVTKLLAEVQGQSKQQEQKLSAVWQSLTSPVKASNFAEIGLENTLKNFGFEAGKDFKMQSAIDGSRLRPDAIIELPAGNVILIDAKTSKYFIEIAAAENNQDALKDKLRASMQTHLAQLAARDYVSAYKAKSENIVVVNVMYLPNDAAYSRVMECDPDFDRKCRDARVLLVTPASMHMLLSIAQHQITREKSEQNHYEIRKIMGQVISSVDVVLRNLNDVGKAIQKSAAEYAKLSTPINNRLIPRIKTAISKGLEPENPVKQLDPLPTFNVLENQPVMIDVEAEETVVSIDKKAV